MVTADKQLVCWLEVEPITVQLASADSIAASECLNSSFIPALPLIRFSGCNHPHPLNTGNVARNSAGSVGHHERLRWKLTGVVAQKSHERFDKRCLAVPPVAEQKPQLLLGRVTGEEYPDHTLHVADKGFVA